MTRAAHSIDSDADRLPPEIPVAGIGHNSAAAGIEPDAPQSDISAFERVERRIRALYDEALGWCDGAPVETQGQADSIAKLIRLIGEARDDAEALRVTEKKPLDAAIAEIQARYNPLIGETKKITGLTVCATEACAQALAPWLAKLAEEQRAAARLARETADRAAEAARLALRQAGADLAARQKAEALVDEASWLADDAKAAKKAKPLAGGAQARDGVGRAIGIKTIYRAEIVDMSALHKWVAIHRRDQLYDFLRDFAERYVKTGDHVIDGADDDPGAYGGELPGVRITAATGVRL